MCGVTDASPMETLSDNQRTMIFILRGILVSPGSRCYSDHLYRGQLYRECYVRSVLLRNKAERNE